MSSRCWITKISERELLSRIRKSEKDKRTLWRLKSVLDFIKLIVRLTSDVKYCSVSLASEEGKVLEAIIDSVYQEKSMLRLDALVFSFFIFENMLRTNVLSIKNHTMGRGKLRSLLYGVEDGKLIYFCNNSCQYPNFWRSYVRLTYHKDSKEFLIQHCQGFFAKCGAGKRFNGDNFIKYIKSGVRYLSYRDFISKKAKSDAKKIKRRLKEISAQKGLIVSLYDVLWGYSESIRYRPYSYIEYVSHYSNSNIQKENEYISKFIEILYCNLIELV